MLRNTKSNTIVFYYLGVTALFVCLCLPWIETNTGVRDGILRPIPGISFLWPVWPVLLLGVALLPWYKNKAISSMGCICLLLVAVALSSWFYGQGPVAQSLRMLPDWENLFSVFGFRASMGYYAFSFCCVGQSFFILGLTVKRGLS